MSSWRPITPPPTNPRRSTIAIDDATIPFNANLPPDASSRVALPPPIDPFANANAYVAFQGLPPVVNDFVAGEAPTKRKGTNGDGAMPSPLRKKKTPFSHPPRSPRRSVAAATLVSIAAAAVAPTLKIPTERSPTSTIASGFILQAYPAR